MEHLSTMGEASAGYLMDETMYAPQVSYSDCYATARFQTLGYDFRVYCEDEALGHYVDRIYGHLAVPGEPEHDYAIYGVGEGPQGPEYRLDIDSDIGLVTHVPSVALAHMLWHINYKVTHTTLDRVLLHSSAAVHDGVGLVFPASMESGKTTLVAGLVRAGLEYVTDEAAALEFDSLALCPYPKPLSVDPGSFGVLSDLEPVVDPELRKYLETQWHLPPGEIGPGRVAGPSQVGFVVSPRYDPDAPTELIPVSRAEGVLLLARNCFNLPKLGTRAFHVLAEVARNARWYRMTVSDLDEAVELICGLVGAIPVRRPHAASSREA